MKCPKCGYTSFDYLESCKKCHADLFDARDSLGMTDLPSEVSPDVLRFPRVFPESSEEPEQAEEIRTEDRDEPGIPEEPSSSETLEEDWIELPESDVVEAVGFPTEEPVEYVGKSPVENLEPADVSVSAVAVEGLDVGSPSEFEDDFLNAFPEEVPEEAVEEAPEETADKVLVEAPEEVVEEIEQVPDEFSAVLLNGIAEEPGGRLAEAEEVEPIKDEFSTETVCPSSEPSLEGPSAFTPEIFSEAAPEEVFEETEFEEPQGFEVEDETGTETEEIERGAERLQAFEEIDLDFVSEEDLLLEDSDDDEETGLEADSREIGDSLETDDSEEGFDFIEYEDEDETLAELRGSVMDSDVSQEIAGASEQGPVSAEASDPDLAMLVSEVTGAADSEVERRPFDPGSGRKPAREFVLDDPFELSDEEILAVIPDLDDE